MRRLYLKFLSTIDRYGMIGRGDRVVVGISGGPDSVCLLHLLHRFKTKLGIENIIAAHVNYSRRGKESDLDQAFVEEVCKDLGVRLHIKNVNSDTYKGNSKDNFQQKAREIRYRFFEKVAKMAGAERIAVAHTEDDQAETVFMRFLEGSGLRGLKGIPPFSGKVIRPLIHSSKQEILDFLASKNLDFRFDSSNKDGCYLRNRVRNEAFPFLNELTGKDVVVKVAGMGDIFREIDGIVQEALEDAMAESFSARNMTVDLTAYRSCPTIVRKALLQQIGYDYLKCEIKHRALGSADKILMGDAPSSSIRISGEYWLVRSYDRGYFTRDGDYFYGKPYCYRIEKPGSYVIKEDEGNMIISEAGIHDIPRLIKILENDPSKAAFNGTDDLFPIVVRNFEEGDRIVPFGMKRGKKIKRLFIENKIPREKRALIPLVIIGGDVAWIPGVKRSNKLPLDGDSKKIIVLEYR